MERRNPNVPVNPPHSLQGVVIVLYCMWELVLEGGSDVDDVRYVTGYSRNDSALLSYYTHVRELQ